MIRSTYPRHRRELEQSLLDAAIIIDMDRVLEHEVDEVGSGFDELVQLLQVLELASLFLIKDIKVVFRGVQLHILHL